MAQSDSTPYSVTKSLAKLFLRRGTRNFYSQSGEDAIVQSALKSKKGFYVDVGSYHPTLYSNTYVFYKKGWEGIAIDPNIRFKRLFQVFRPRDTFICTGIGATESTFPYYRFNDAAYNTFDVASAEEYKQLRWMKLLGTDQVQVVPLGELLKKQHVTAIDFLNIDVEGKDIEVLKSHDWTIPTKVVAVEDRHFDSNEPHKSEVYEFLYTKGYTLTGLTRDSLIFTMKAKTS
jgi:FkbM family methyltransferase